MDADEVRDACLARNPTQLNTDWIPRHMQMKDIRLVDDPSRIERCRLR